MSSDTLISIIVPIFNVEEYVSECIKSIKKQTWKHIQIILVDDGSTDQSGTICDKYAASDQRIEVIHQQNKGLVAARKSGLQIAKGEYIGFVDGDDYITANMYEKLLKIAQKDDADFVHSGIWNDNKKRVSFTRKCIEFCEKSEKEEFLGEEVFRTKNMLPSVCIKLFRADLLKESYQKVPDNASWGEDLLNTCICVMECRRISFLDEAYYFYRKRENSITTGIEFGDIVRIFKLYENIQRLLAEYDCYEKLQDLIENYIYQNLKFKMCAYLYNDFQIGRYYYEDVDKLQGKKIVIYGAGNVGKSYYAQICRYTDCEVVAWVDATPEKYEYYHIELYAPEILETLDFDILIIAIKNTTIAKEIFSQLVNRGIEKNKILWTAPKLYDENRIIRELGRKDEC